MTRVDLIGYIPQPSVWSLAISPGQAAIPIPAFQISSLSVCRPLGTGRPKLW